MKLRSTTRPPHCLPVPTHSPVPRNRQSRIQAGFVSTPEDHFRDTIELEFGPSATWKRQFSTTRPLGLSTQTLLPFWGHAGNFRANPCNRKPCASPKLCPLSNLALDV